MILLIDNYDSFTYNLVQRLGELDPNLNLEVVRNDQISAEQVGEFAGNVLFLEDGRAGPLVAVSRRAWASFAPSQRSLIERHARPVPCAIDTIEQVGGGGIRCMLAESFLPRAD